MVFVYAICQKEKEAREKKMACGYNFSNDDNYDGHK